jgi:hypothetical protein
MLEKGYHRIWEANLQPLGAKQQQAKNAQSWPYVLLALTPSVEGPLNS